MVKDILLEIELVPQTSHFKNLRSDLKTKEWDLLRKDSYKKAGHKCEICGGKGPNWPVECHEIWDYNEEEKMQTLLGLISLCPSCHETKHFGLAQVRGRDGIAMEHLMKINNWSEHTAKIYIHNAFVKWQERSQEHWEFDISWAYEKIEELTK